MDKTLNLKIALAAVIVGSAAFIGYSWNQQITMKRSIENFALEMSEANTEQEAAIAVTNFFRESNSGVNPQMASAGFWGWLKKAFGGGGSNPGGGMEASDPANYPINGERERYYSPRTEIEQ